MKPLSSRLQGLAEEAEAHGWTIFAGLVLDAASEAEELELELLADPPEFDEEAFHAHP